MVKRKNNRSRTPLALFIFSKSFSSFLNSKFQIPKFCVYLFFSSLSISPFPRAVDVNRFTDKRKRIPEISSFVKQKQNTKHEDKKKIRSRCCCCCCRQFEKGFNNQKTGGGRYQQRDTDQSGLSWWRPGQRLLCFFYSRPPVNRTHSLSCVSVHSSLCVCVCGSRH